MSTLGHCNNEESFSERDIPPKTQLMRVGGMQHMGSANWMLLLSWVQGRVKPNEQSEDKYCFCGHTFGMAIFISRSSESRAARCALSAFLRAFSSLCHFTPHALHRVLGPVAHHQGKLSTMNEDSTLQIFGTESCSLPPT